MSLESKSIGIRLPESLRVQLADAAERADRSLNGEIVHRLSNSLTAASTAANRVFAALELPKHMRLRSTATSSDINRILDVCRCLAPEQLVLAAQENALNGATLALIIETPACTFLMDGSSINMARDPRISEVAGLFSNLDSLGLLDTARTCIALIRDTSALQVEEAIDVIAREGRPTNSDIPGFLKLLSRHGHFDIASFRTPRRN